MNYDFVSFDKFSFKELQMIRDFAEQYLHKGPTCKKKRAELRRDLREMHRHLSSGIKNENIDIAFIKYSFCLNENGKYKKKYQKLMLN